MWLVEGSIFSSSLSSLWPTFVGLFTCLDFGPCPLFPFLSLLGCFLSIKFSIKFGKVSWISFVHVHTHCFEVVLILRKHQVVYATSFFFLVTTPPTKVETLQVTRIIDPRSQQSKKLDLALKLIVFTFWKYSFNLELNDFSFFKKKENLDSMILMKTKNLA